MSGLAIGLGALVFFFLFPMLRANLANSPGWYNPKKEKFADLDHELGEFQSPNPLFSLPATFLALATAQIQIRTLTARVSALTTVTSQPNGPTVDRSRTSHAA